jgi:4,5-dihydroxyphthalate decarboxylase
MLVHGELDAAFLLHIPEYHARTPARVTRLFPDYKNTELEYFRRTGIHPMMHCVVLQKNIYERNPWVLHSLYKALCDARRQALEKIGDIGHLSTILPTLPAAAEEARRIFGDDP